MTVSLAEAGHPRAVAKVVGEFSNRHYAATSTVVHKL